MYIDTSVAIKLYVAEPDSEQCEAIVSGFPLVSSRLLYCELRAALRAKWARGMITERIMEEAWATFEHDIASQLIQFVTLDDRTVIEAATLLARLPPALPLRPLDALHLLSFEAIETESFFTRDARMRNVADYLGYPLAG